MYQEKIIKPMPDLAFRVMAQVTNIMDTLKSPFSDSTHLLNKIPLREGMTVLDYGCGAGRYTIPVAESVGPGGKVIAVDIQHLAIKTVKKKAADKSLANIRTILASSYNTAIPSSSVDAVLLIDVIHMIRDHGELFREIYRVLKLDGFLFMDSGHMKRAKVTELIESSGLLSIDNIDGKNLLVTRKVRA